MTKSPAESMATDGMSLTAGRIRIDAELAPLRSRPTEL